MPHAKKKALVPSYTSTLNRSGGGWVEGGGGGGVPPYFLHREGGGVQKGLMLFMNGPLHSLPRGKEQVFLSNIRQYKTK